MPPLPFKPCKKCGRLTRNRYCSEHEQLEKQYDRQRNAEDPFRRLYKTIRWKWTRLAVLARDRICVVCHVWASEEADHKIPARLYVAQHGGDMNRFYDTDNLQGLCKKCHSRKTATEDGGGW